MELMRKINLVIGYILLTPGVYSVGSFFLLQLTGINLIKFYKDQKDQENFDLDPFIYWVGAGGFTSALPFYFALMAIAGAYLITANIKAKQNGNTGD